MRMKIENGSISRPLFNPRTNLPSFPLTPSLHSPNSTSSCSPNRLPFVSLPSSPHTHLDFQTRGFRLPQASLAIELEEENDSDSESSSEKSRNQKKREARRSVKWGMELSKFSTPQIKKILRIASLEKEVFDAIVLVKKFGPEVREGRRRQYNYIGRLLHEVQPELMDTLIQASKDGDHSKIEELPPWLGPLKRLRKKKKKKNLNLKKKKKKRKSEVETYLVSFTLFLKKKQANKDENLQELRKLVRNFHSIQSGQSSEGREGASDAALASAKKSLTRFLRSLAKQMPTEYY